MLCEFDINVSYLKLNNIYITALGHYFEVHDFFIDFF